MNYRAIIGLCFLQGSIAYAAETISPNSPTPQDGNQPPVIQSKDAGGQGQTTIVDEGGSLKIIEAPKKNAAPNASVPGAANNNLQNNSTENVPNTNIQNPSNNMQNNMPNNPSAPNMPNNTLQEQPGSNEPNNTMQNNAMPNDQNNNTNNNSAVPPTSAQPSLTPEQIKAITNSVREQVQQYHEDNVKKTGN